MCLKLFLLVLGAAGIHAADLPGHYYLQNVREVGSELLLKPDGTFEFMLAYGAADYQATGKWRAEKGFVVLKADGKKEPPFRLTRSAATQEPGTRVWVLAPNGRPVPNIDVAVETPGGASKARTSNQGDASFPETRAATSAKFEIRVYELTAGPFALNPAHNEFWFEINGDAITRVDFDDERLAIDGQALVMKHFGADHPMRYEKQ